MIFLNMEKFTTLMNFDKVKKCYQLKSPITEIDQN